MAGGTRAHELAWNCLLRRFYEPVLTLKAKWSGGDYAEFRTGVGVLAIFAAESQEKYIQDPPKRRRTAA
jgi:hypothetical protein